MLWTSYRFNMRSIVKFMLLAAVVIYLLDAEVEAGKSRKKGQKHRRSKRTHGDKERRKGRGRRVETEEIKIDAHIDNRLPSPSLIKLVEAQQKLRGHKVKVETPVMDEMYGGHHSSLIKEYIQNRLRNRVTIEDDKVTVLPVIHASVDFMIKREKSPYFYEQTTSSLGGINPSELGLVSVHTAKGKYGLHSASDHIFGRVIHIADAGRLNSHFGCGNAIENLHEIPRNGEPWVALIERGHCAFFTKIKLAERNNASAVIIYDNKQEEVPKMNTIGTKIVSVAISRHDGHKITRLTDTGTKVIVNIGINTNPDIATKPDITTSATRPYVREVVQERPGGNGAKANNGAMIMTILTALLSMMLQSITS